MPRHSTSRTWALLAASLLATALGATTGVSATAATTPTTAAPATTPAAAPAARLLNTGVAAQVLEPDGDGVDSANTRYSDHYLWNMCGPGATTVAASYWKDVLHNGRRTFHDPHATTTWDDTHARSFMFYLATQVAVPGWPSPGEMSYGAYPDAGTATSDVRDVLNWEASGHNTSTWRGFYYGVADASTLNASTLNQHVVSDVGQDGRPVVAALDAYYLKEWAGGYHTSHLVAVIGYDNTKHTYTYVETCGRDCHTSSSGVETMTQDAFLNAIEQDLPHNKVSGGLVW
jgi:hypothetical protein